VPGDQTSSLRGQLDAEVGSFIADLNGANAAREESLALCRQVIRLSGSSIRAVHRRQPDEAAALRSEAEAALRRAQDVLGPFPLLLWAGFLHDAEKEYAEAVLAADLIAGAPLAGPTTLGVDGRSWTKGLAEAASELRRHLLDRLRDGELDEGVRLLRVMEEVYDGLMVVDFPDALTAGLRRTLDQLRAVLERSRGDVTTTVVQERLRGAVERASQ
jgi:translin